VTETICVVVIAVLVVALVWLVTAKRRDQEALALLQAGKSGLESRAEELATRINSLEADKDELSRRLEVEQSLRVRAETRLEAEQKNLREQKALLDKAREQLSDTFKALSAEALKDSRIQFLSQADEKLRPIQNLLKDYEQKLDTIEKARNTAYGGLEQHLNELLQSGQKWEKEAHQLSTALKSPTGSGEWGQLALRNVVEMAGMSKHCDFDEQVAVVTEDGLKKPDMTVLLPNHRTIVVDAKAPLNAYREAVNAPDDKARGEALSRHAQAVRGHMRALSQKSYWAQFKPTPEFVVLFLPGESFFAGAVEQDHALIEDSMKSGVVLASPTTLLALLKAVAYGWRQEEMAENAERIGQAGKDLYDRLAKFVEHFSGIGDALSRAGKAFDAAVGSYQSRIQPAARRLAEQAAVSDKELPDVPPVDGPTRALPAPDGESQAEGG
jgi:DNA recombination protein RmuC